MQPRHHSLLNWSNSVLVVVDLQEPFLRKIDDRSNLIIQCSLLVSAAKILNIPIITTTQNAHRMGEVVQEITNLFGDESVQSIDKLSFSCAGEPRFTDYLQQLGREQVLICGVETHICVLQTALDLRNLDYEVQVVANAVSSRSQVCHQLGLSKISFFDVPLVSAEGAVMELLQTAKSTEFKSILALIK